MGTYHVPLPAEYFAAFSSCLYCCAWGGLSVCWKFVVPLYCGLSSLWVELNEWLVKVSWLGKLVSVFWWVELDRFSLKCNDVSNSEFWISLILYVYVFSCHIANTISQSHQIMTHLLYCTTHAQVWEEQNKSFAVLFVLEVYFNRDGCRVKLLCFKITGNNPSVCGYANNWVQS